MNDEINYVKILKTMFPGVKFTPGADDSKFEEITFEEGSELTIEEVQGAIPAYLFSLKIEEVKEEFQSLMDEEAQKYGFDNMMSARSWTGIPSAMQDKAVQLSDWCAKTWERLQTGVKTGTIQTEEDAMEQYSPFVLTGE